MTSKKPAKKFKGHARRPEAPKQAKVSATVQIGRKRPTDVIVPIKVSKKTEQGLLRMADGNGVIHISEADLMTAVGNYLRPKAEADLQRVTTSDKVTIGDVLSAKNVLFSQLPFVECDQAEIPKILDIAKEIIHGDREQAYGDPRFNLDTIAKFWTLYMHRLFHSWGIEGATLKAEDVAQMMILLKTARLIHNPTHKDSLVDQAGYAALQGRINGL